MELGSVVQRSVDMLHLYLYDRPLHPELFRHFAEYRVVQGQYQAQLWITGLSHVVTISLGQRSLTELVCDETEMLPTRGVLTRFRMKGERDVERSGPDGWHYMVSSQVEAMDEALYKSVHNDLVRHAAKRGCFFPYENWAEGGLVPFTYIDHEAWNREFHVHAFHAFPGERTLVKTQSIFELPG